MINEKIRLYARKKGVPLWKVAEKIGVSEATFNRRLRHELPTEETDRLIAVIDDCLGGGWLEK